MKTRRLELMVTGMVAALCAQLSLAQQSGQSQSSQIQSDQQQSQSAGQMGQASSQATGSMAAECRVSKLKGADIKSNAGESLGKVQDLVIDPQTGKVKFAILGRGGVLGIGEKYYPVPWQAVSVQSEKQFTLNIDKQKMQTAPTTKSDYSELNNPDYVVSIYRFYQIEPSAIGAPGETPGGMGGGMGKSAATNAPSSNP